MNRILLKLIAICALFYTWVVYADTNRQKRVSSSVTKSDPNGYFKFPIVLPPYNYVELDQNVVGSCLLYLESFSISVTQNSEKKKSNPITASALVSGENTNQFYFDNSFVKCYSHELQNDQFTFRISINLNETIESKPHESQTFFYLSDKIDFILYFDIKNYSWKFTNIKLVSSISIKKKEQNDWLSEDLTIKDEHLKKINSFGSFKDYCYACYNTPIATWIIDKPNPIIVGLTLNNLQIQASNITPTNNLLEKKVFRFTTKVNDCVGTFSVGSWMSIISILIFFFILSFAFLMLNSVQTMDRFDDPKQKQLIVNVKE